ncbi:MAG TPA: hypothetical protein VK616_04895, partial [Flavitalea sp.]|nr:hypothetical protein [Flavitalea sp.]
DKTIRNGFTRTFHPDKILKKQKHIGLKYNSFYVAGNTRHGIYLGNSEGPRHLLWASTTLDTTHLVYSLENPDRLKFGSVRVKVDSPYFYMLDGTGGSIFKGILKELIAFPFVATNNYFLEAIPSGRSTFAIKSLMKADNEMSLGQITTKPLHFKFHPEILKKQIDGIFCKEGMMEFNNQISRLIYTYHYRNQFIVMDSNLQVIYKGQTIDTTSVAKVKILESSTHGFRAPASPPVMVNKTFSVNENYLFINSGLVADNEDRKLFDNNSVIDVYELTRGKYLYSFYIPNHLNKRLSHFRVLRDVVVVLFARDLISFIYTSPIHAEP